MDAPSSTAVARTVALPPEAADTFPRLLLWHARTRPDRPAMREKDLGIWQCWDWAQVAQIVGTLACALHQLGLRRGDHLAIIGDNRPRLYWSMLAAQCLGAIAVPLYQDAVAAEMAYVLQDAEVAIAVAEDQEQVDKLLELRAQCPALAHILFDDPRGMRHYAEPGLLDLDEALERGREFAHAHPEFVTGEIARGRTTDVAVMLYTSGTTGRPKGVCQTHASFIATARGDAGFDHYTDADELLSYLPMAWVGDHLFSYALALTVGFCVNCPESSGTVPTDLREIGPTCYFAPPRVFENLLTQVTIRMQDAGVFKRRLYAYFMAVARRAGAAVMDGRAASLPWGDRLRYALGEWLVYGPLRNVLGLSRLRLAYTGGAAIGPDLFEFYRSLGINLKQLYGQTETCVYVCKQPDGEVRPETVGKPLPGVRLRVADSGEVLVHSPGLMAGYYRQAQATAESVDADGWFHTGDAGYFDGDGHLRIIDRARDVGRLGDGTLFAPQYIENKLKFFPHIKEAVAFGDGRDRCCVFLNIDAVSVGDWAERRGLAYGGYADLAGKAEVLDLVAACVESVNADLARDPALCNSQVHRFLVLHKELDPDDDELTRTRKVRRGFVAQKYAILVDALYADVAVQHVETEVKFEDGRRGLVAADLVLRDAQVFPATPGALS